MQRLLSFRVGLAIALVAYFAAALYGHATDRYLNDEGLLTYLFASLSAHDFAPAFFLQKTRPPLSVLYAVPASFGLTSFTVAHIIIGATALPLVAATARALGHRHPALPAWVLAFSPLFVAGSAAGLSNTDAVVGIALAGYLYAVRRSNLAAGIVLGALCWVRSEVAVLAAIALAFGAVRRDVRLVSGLAAFGVVYGLAGSVYHQDLLWLFHYPPALPSSMPGNPQWDLRPSDFSALHLTGAALAITPAVLLAGFVPWKSLRGIERIAVAFVVTFGLALLVMPAFQAFNFNRAPRYFLPLLPALAILISRAFDRLEDVGSHPVRHGAWFLAAGLGLAFAVERMGGRSSALAAVGLVAAAVALARARRPQAGRALVLVLLAVGPLGFRDGAFVDRFSQAPHLDEMVEKLEGHAGGSRRVYTNEPLLATFASRRGNLEWAEVHYLIQEDQRYEIDELTNKSNGQRAAIWAGLERWFYGPAVRPGALKPDDVGDALFALTKDERQELTMPPEVWGEALVVVDPGYGVSILARRGDNAD